MIDPALDGDAVRGALETELRKLRKINRVLMDRVERDMDAHGGNAYGMFRTAITLETQIRTRTAELTALTRQLSHEVFERRQAEAALLAAKAEAERANLGKTRFLAAATHDLYQPLNAARLFLGALGVENGAGKRRDLVERIDSALDTVDELLAALVDMSKLDSGAWPVAIHTVAIGPMLARLAAEYRPQAQSHGLDLRVVPSTALIRTDRALFERVLRNLLSNAIRYTAEGRVLAGCRRRAGSLRVEVWDTGVGIPDFMHRKIFEEFERLENAPRRSGAGLGLGLGLAIVDRIARLLDLGVDVTSSLGSGSCFSVTVPLSTERGGDDPAVLDPADVRSLAGSTIVVIDNDPSALEAARVLLEAWGCTVIGAAGWRQASAWLDAADEMPDLIVADYHLDAGTDGPEAIEALRERYGRGIPACVMSGDRSAATRLTLKASGYPLLAKPVSAARLRAMVSYLVRPPGT